jgi:hypothetical protein
MSQKKLGSGHELNQYLVSKMIVLSTQITDSNFISMLLYQYTYKVPVTQSLMVIGGMVGSDWHVLYILKKKFRYFQK